MSRIGRMPIPVPPGVSIEVGENNHVVVEAGEDTGPNVIAYLNRLSDLLWLLGRLLELRAGVDAKLRDTEHEGPRWSRAW